jgi:site-specific DNA-adenine methylase
MTTPLRAPFHYFGGKADAAPIVWRALGDVANYVEPFFGSGAVLLNRPHAPRVETVNDADALLANFWRATQAAPAEVAEHADWPVNEADLEARHLWLVRRKPEIAERARADPEWYDARAAGWWAWGAAQWIGSGWCSGPISKKRPELGSSGKGLHKARVLGKPLLGNSGQGLHRPGVQIREWINALSDRLRRVRVCCGDWSRVVTSAVTHKHLEVIDGKKPCGVFLDPPYSTDVRVANLYAHDSGDVASDVRAWCLEHGTIGHMRIVLAGYDSEGHEALLGHGWRVTTWSSKSRFRGSLTSNQQHRERLYLSPACLDVGEPARQRDLFGEAAT